MLVGFRAANFPCRQDLTRSSNSAGLRYIDRRELACRSDGIRVNICA
jgi:hypothetical protein